jgi:hypothetical protein
MNIQSFLLQFFLRTLFSRVLVYLSYLPGLSSQMGQSGLSVAARDNASPAARARNFTFSAACNGITIGEKVS